LDPNLKEDFVQQFERRHLTRDLAKAFASLPEEETQSESGQFAAVAD
jgi:hypothetical protein